ncbi:MAG: hypothetical protein JWL63_3238 [Rhodocyclales bacterium]|nr:hypothetical protein [Rhodocyclales bacterium]
MVTMIQIQRMDNTPLEEGFRLIATPVDHTGKINGEVIKLHPKEPLLRYIHKSQSYVISVVPVDRVELATSEMAAAAKPQEEVAEVLPG